MKNYGCIIFCYFLINSCVTTVQSIQNKKETVCFYDQAEYTYGTYQFSFYFKSRKYKTGNLNMKGLIQFEDRFKIVFDSLNPEIAFPIFYQPIIDSFDRYYEDQATVVNILNKHWIPMYNGRFRLVSFSYYAEINNKKTLIIRDQYFRRSYQTDFIDELKVGDKIRIFVNPNNLKLSFVKINNYYKW